MGTQLGPDYHREYQRRKYAQRKPWAINLLGGRCVRCGSDNADDLQFDHIDPETKDFNIADGLSKYSIKRLTEELAKCQLLCTLCHTIKTAKENINQPVADRIARNQRRIARINERKIERETRRLQQAPTEGEPA